MAVYAAVMESEAKRNGKSCAWVCKSTQNVLWADAIERFFDSPKYIFLHRDPRDVYLSFRNTFIGEKHPYCVASRWADLQTRCLALEARVGPERLWRLSYAQLVTDPEGSIRDICEWLGVRFKPEALNCYLGEEARKTARAGSQWKNVILPVSGRSLDVHLRSGDINDFKIIERTALPVMENLGYSPKHWNPATKSIDGFAITEKQRFHQLNQEWKAQAISEADDYELAGRKRQQAVIDSIVNRRRVLATTTGARTCQ